jgi:thioredoxin 1
MNYNIISSEEQYESIIRENLGVLLYFSRISCNVGEALEPKVINLLKEKFPKIPFYFVDMDKTPTIPVKYSVFVEPTIVVVFDGKETIRKSRIISIGDLSDSIDRIYKLAFD